MIKGLPEDQKDATVDSLASHYLWHPKQIKMHSFLQDNLLGYYLHTYYRGTIFAQNR